MSREPTLAASFTRIFVEATTDMGLDPAHLLAQVELEPQDLQDPDARIPARLQLDLWDHAARLTGDLYLGIHVGEHTKLGRWGIVEHIILLSATVEDAMKNVIRYWQLIVDGKILKLEQEGDTARFTFDGAFCSNRHANECDMVYITRFIQMVLGATFAPLAVWFAHPQEGDLTTYTRWFQAPVHFNRPDSGFAFDASWLGQPLATANAPLFAYTSTQAEQQLANLGGDLSITRKVEVLIHRDLQGVTLAGIAESLSVEPRTLQRELKKEGMSFKHLLNEVRKERALTYLNNLDMPLSEIAFLLGFSEISAFYRAIKRWCGITAKAYRTTLRANTE